MRGCTPSPNSDSCSGQMAAQAPRRHHDEHRQYRQCTRRSLDLAPILEPVRLHPCAAESIAAGPHRLGLTTTSPPRGHLASLVADESQGASHVCSPLRRLHEPRRSALPAMAPSRCGWLAERTVLDAREELREPGREHDPTARREKARPDQECYPLRESLTDGFCILRTGCESLRTGCEHRKSGAHSCE